MSAPSKKSRKPYVASAGTVGPVTQLKLRPLEDREWAFSLAGSLSGKDAIIQIKNKLGIDLKWDICYSRFLQWQDQQHRLEDYAESLRQRDEFGALGDTDSPESCRHGHAALLMEEAVRNQDGKTFIGVARVSIAESRLEHYARKIDAAERRVELDRKRLDWEIKKHRYAIVAAKPPRSHLSNKEKRRRIRVIYGMSEETAEDIREAKERQNAAQPVENGS